MGKKSVKTYPCRVGRLRPHSFGDENPGGGGTGG